MNRSNSAEFRLNKWEFFYHGDIFCTVEAKKFHNAAVWFSYSYPFRSRNLKHSLLRSQGKRPHIKSLCNFPKAHSLSLRTLLHSLSLHTLLWSITTPWNLSFLFFLHPWFRVFMEHHILLLMTQSMFRVAVKCAINIVLPITSRCMNSSTTNAQGWPAHGTVQARECIYSGNSTLPSIWMGWTPT